MKKDDPYPSREQSPERPSDTGSEHDRRRCPLRPRRGAAPLRSPRTGRRRSAAPRLAVVLVLLVAALFALFGSLRPAPALAAEGDFVFTGRGWGHGVGMSQWGAWQAAKDGVGFESILAFYYPGATLDRLAGPEPELRVRISSTPWTTNTVNFFQVDLKPSVTPMLLVMQGAAGTETEEIALGSFVNVFNSRGRVEVVTAEGRLGPFDHVEARPAAPAAGAPTEEGRIAIQIKTSATSSPLAYREYWGSLRVQPGDGSGQLAVYNHVLLEKYLRSIAEVDYDWAVPKWSAAYAPEAVKAQAVASRTYAVAKGGPLYDNERDQCYRGYTFEKSYPGIAAAAEETAGLILRYQGKPITAYFSAHSGGYTTNSAWSGITGAYLPAQPDPWSLKAPPASIKPPGPGGGPGYNWSYTVSPATLSAKVNNALTDVDTKKKFDVGLIKRVEVASRDTADPASHARTLRLTGDKGVAHVSAASFRALFGYRTMASTLFLSITGGEPLPQGEFYDVGPNHLYHDEIARIAKAGLVNGYVGGLFKPEGSITRWQFAKIAVNLYNIMHPDDQIQVVDVTVAPFADVPARPGVLLDESDWVAAAKGAGLVTASVGNNFQPYVVIRRDLMAGMMCRALGWDEEAARLPLTTPGFSDIGLDNTWWAAATYLKQRGIILGYLDGTLRPEEPIKRQHVAVILCRALDLVP